eukprot:SAG31_NODE_5809_length_2317_cov_1.564022_1_plen_163_part_00
MALSDCDDIGVLLLQIINGSHNDQVLFSPTLAYCRRPCIRLVWSPIELRQLPSPWRQAWIGTCSASLTIITVTWLHLCYSLITIGEITYDCNRCGSDPEKWSYNKLGDAIDAGLTSEAALDAVVRRILGQKFAAGLFDGRSFVDYENLGLLDSPSHRQLAVS